MYCSRLRGQYIHTTMAIHTHNYVHHKPINTRRKRLLATSIWKQRPIKRKKAHSCRVRLENTIFQGKLDDKTANILKKRCNSWLYCHTRIATHCNTLIATLTLQHTHCNTHTATHCNTLQHTATHCNTLQHTAVCCSVLQYLQCFAVCCSVVQCVAMCVKTSITPIYG